MEGSSGGPRVAFVVVTKGLDYPSRPEERRPSGARYTRDSIRNVLQFMGCKPRHAYKAAQLVFQKLERFAAEGKFSSGSRQLWGVGVHEDDEVYVSMPRSEFYELVCSTLTEYNYKYAPSSDEIKAACSLKERRRHIIVLLCGTSGSGKSTLASILAGRLGISTVLSTDSIRHMMRSFTTPVESPLLFASTYEAGEALKQQQAIDEVRRSQQRQHQAEAEAASAASAAAQGYAAASAGPAAAAIGAGGSGSGSGGANGAGVGGDALPASGTPGAAGAVATPAQLSMPASAPVPTPAPGPHAGLPGSSGSGPGLGSGGGTGSASASASASSGLPGSAGAGSSAPGASAPNAHEQAIRGYKAQCELVSQQLEALVSGFEARRQSLVVEGVHLHVGLVMRLLQRHPGVVPFLVYIKSEGKHVERMAVRAKYMTLDPNKNKYVKNMRNIRWIQDYLLRKAEKHAIPCVENTNIDRSVGLIHLTLLGCLKRMMKGETVLDAGSGTARMLAMEYAALVEAIAAASTASTAATAATATANGTAAATGASAAGAPAANGAASGTANGGAAGDGAAAAAGGGDGGVTVGSGGRSGVTGGVLAALSEGSGSWPAPPNLRQLGSPRIFGNQAEPYAASAAAAAAAAAALLAAPLPGDASDGGGGVSSATDNASAAAALLSAPSPRSSHSGRTAAPYTSAVQVVPHAHMRTFSAGDMAPAVALPLVYGTTAAPPGSWQAGQLAAVASSPQRSHAHITLSRGRSGRRSGHSSPRASSSFVLLPVPQQASQPGQDWPSPAAEAAAAALLQPALASPSPRQRRPGAGGGGDGSGAASPARSRTPGRSDGGAPAELELPAAAVAAAESFLAAGELTGPLEVPPPPLTSLGDPGGGLAQGTARSWVQGLPLVQRRPCSGPHTLAPAPPSQTQLDLLLPQGQDGEGSTDPTTGNAGAGAGCSAGGAAGPSASPPPGPSRGPALLSGLLQLARHQPPHSPQQLPSDWPPPPPPLPPLLADAGPRAGAVGSPDSVLTEGPLGSPALRANSLLATRGGGGGGGSFRSGSGGVVGLAAAALGGGSGSPRGTGAGGGGNGGSGTNVLSVEQRQHLDAVLPAWVRDLGVGGGSAGGRSASSAVTAAAAAALLAPTAVQDSGVPPAASPAAVVGSPVTETSLGAAAAASAQNPRAILNGARANGAGGGDPPRSAASNSVSTASAEPAVATAPDPPAVLMDAPTAAAAAAAAANALSRFGDQCSDAVLAAVVASAILDEQMDGVTEPGSGGPASASAAASRAQSGGAPATAAAAAAAAGRQRPSLSGGAADAPAGAAKAEGGGGGGPSADTADARAPPAVGSSGAGLSRAPAAAAAPAGDGRATEGALGAQGLSASSGAPAAAAPIPTPNGGGGSGTEGTPPESQTASAAGVWASAAAAVTGFGLTPATSGRQLGGDGSSSASEDGYSSDDDNVDRYDRYEYDNGGAVGSSGGGADSGARRRRRRRGPRGLLEADSDDVDFGLGGYGGLSPLQEYGSVYESATHDDMDEHGDEDMEGLAPLGRSNTLMRHLAGALERSRMRASAAAAGVAAAAAAAAAAGGGAGSGGSGGGGGGAEGGALQRGPPPAASSGAAGRLSGSGARGGPSALGRPSPGSGSGGAKASAASGNASGSGCGSGGMRTDASGAAPGSQLRRLLRGSGGGQQGTGGSGSEIRGPAAGSGSASSVGPVGSVVQRGVFPPIPEDSGSDTSRMPPALVSTETPFAAAALNGAGVAAEARSGKAAEPAAGQGSAGHAGNG